MGKISKIFISTILSLVFAFPVAAQVVPVQENVRSQIREMRQNVAVDANEIKQEFQNKLQKTRQLMEQERNEFQERIQAKREDTKKLMEQNREQLKERLQNIKDEGKRKIVERIDKNISKLNERLMNHFSQVLARLENVLEKIITRTDKAEMNGHDVLAVRQAIVLAQGAITSARAAIETQSGKVYEIAVSGENALRADVGAARQAFHADVVVVRDAVFAAREAIKNVLQELRKIPNIDTFDVPASGTGAATTTGE